MRSQKENKVMKKYRTYEGTNQKETSFPDTRTEKEWFGYYQKEISKIEYPTFEGWIWDMLRSGVFEENKRGEK